MMQTALVKSENFSIRLMDSSDIANVCDMATRIWRAHYVPHIVSAAQVEYMLPRVCSLSAMKRYINERKQRFWLLEVQGILKAYIAVEPREHGVWFVDKLYVDMDTQRSGFGAALLSHVKTIHSASELKLRVNRKNISAINFYFKQGFAIEALDVFDIGGGFVMDDYLMSNKVKNT